MKTEWILPSPFLTDCPGQTWPWTETTLTTRNTCMLNIHTHKHTHTEYNTQTPERYNNQAAPGERVMGELVPGKGGCRLSKVWQDGKACRQRRGRGLGVGEGVLAPRDAGHTETHAD